MSKAKKTSTVDELYFKLFGEHQKKEGQALERLSAIAFTILDGERKVLYDQQVRGKYSDTVYQIDGLIESDENRIMVEAKDYTVQNKKVGRADLQKLEGALTDLDIPEGTFVSATDYTNRAKPYADSTKINPKQNPINLFHIRPSNPEDMRGRIKTIVVNLIAHGLEFESGKYIPKFNKEDFDNIKYLIPENGKQLSMTLYQFYDANGCVCETFENITRQINSCLPYDFEKGFILKGEWLFEQPTYMVVPALGKLRIDSLIYEIPTYSDELSFAINQSGDPVLFIKSEDGKIDKLITDDQIKSYQLLNGQIKRR